MAKQSRIKMDQSAFPLIVITIPDVELDDDDCHVFIDEQREMLRQRRVHGVVADARRSRVARPRQRQILADWLKEAKEPSARYTAAMAIVISSPLMRGALTAIFWIAEPACPTKAVSSLEEGVEFVLGKLRERGVDVTAAERFASLY